MFLLYIINIMDGHQRGDVEEHRKMVTLFGYI